jgi:alpha-L-rhamnosidase
VGDYEEITLTAVVTHTDLKANSHFECDNEMINAIHKATVRSILTNCQGVMVDCPHREQNPWTGDGMMSSEAINMGFDAFGLFYEWMLKFKDEQLASGGLPCIIPMKNNIWEYNFANGSDFDSAIFFIPYYTYKYTGKQEIVDLMWENMRRSLDYFGSLSDGYLLSNGVGDWAPVGECCDKQITDTTYYRKDALMMAEMAEATGRDPSPFIELAENIKKAFRKEYIKDGRFTVMHQTALSCAIYGDFLSEDEKEIAVNDLKHLLVDSDYRFILGVHGLVMIFDALSENGGIQELFDTVINDRHDGYAKCIAQGHTTLTEHFQMNDSLNHHFRSPVDVWFYKHLAGIRLCGFGYDDVIIEPKFVKGINSLKADMHGICVSYNECELTVESPYKFTLILNGEGKTYPAGTHTVKR